MGTQTAATIGSQRDAVALPPQPEADSATTCCGQPMEVRLARAHDRWGQTVFVTVWHCVGCGREVLCD